MKHAFKALALEAGGRDQFIAAVNQAMDEADMPETRLNARSYYAWGSRKLTVTRAMWALLGARRCGVSLQKALELCPELKIAADTAQEIVGGAQ